LITQSDTHTVPPCLACDAHNELEDKFTEMKSRNYTEHAEIKTTLKWMILIGSALVTGIGVIFLMVWNLHTDGNEAVKAVTRIEYNIKGISEDIKESNEQYNKDKTLIYEDIKECRRDIENVYKNKNRKLFEK